MITLALSLALQADSADALQKLNEQILAADAEKSAALIKALVLPDSAAWFKKTFGDEVGAKLDAEYQAMTKDLDAGLGVEQDAEPRPHQRVVVRDGDADHSGNRAHTR